MRWGAARPPQKSQHDFPALTRVVGLWKPPEWWPLEGQGGVGAGEVTVESPLGSRRFEDGRPCMWPRSHACAPSCTWPADQAATAFEETSGCVRDAAAQMRPRPDPARDAVAAARRGPRQLAFHWSPARPLDLGVSFVVCELPGTARSRTPPAACRTVPVRCWAGAIRPCPWDVSRRLQVSPPGCSDFREPT